MRSGRSGGQRLGGLKRQHDHELGALAGLALDLDAAAEQAGDDGVHDVQTQAGTALAHLGGEEGVEDLAQRDLVHAAAIVAANDTGPIVAVALGLDLRGGVHFLMQVDMKGALDRAADRNASDIRSLMREKKIQYGGVDKAGDTIAVKFSDPAERDKASKEISTSNADLLIKEDGAAQDLRLVVTLKEDAKRKLADAAIEQNQKVLGNRINALGLTEPIIQKQGADRIVIQVPGASDPARLKDVIGRTGTLELRMVEADASKNSASLQAAQNGNVPFGTELMNDRDGGQILVKKQYVITGERINGAEPAFDSQNNQPIVRVSTDGQGARILREVTGQNVGNRMAIVLIEKGKPEVITAPTIQSELGSNFQIRCSGRHNSRLASNAASRRQRRNATMRLQLLRSSETPYSSMR